MAIASQKFWNRYEDARVQPEGWESTIPFVDFAIIHRILFADGKVYKGDLPTLGRNDRLYIRCSDDPDANVMRYAGKWYALTRADAHALAKGVFDGANEDEDPVVVRGA